MLKKITGLSLAALMLFCLIAGGAWAYFTDSETSTGNPVMAGTLDLMTSTDGSVDRDNPYEDWTWSNGVTQNISMTSFKPNCLIPRLDAAVIYLKNTGSIDGVSMYITFSAVEDDADVSPNPGGDVGLDDTLKAIKVQQIFYDRIPLLDSITDDGDGVKTLYDLVQNGLPVQGGLKGSQGVDLQELWYGDGTDPDPEFSDYVKEFSIQFVVRDTTFVTNSFQGDGITLTIAFNLTQQ